MVEGAEKALLSDIATSSTLVRLKRSLFLFRCSLSLAEAAFTIPKQVYVQNERIKKGSAHAEGPSDSVLAIWTFIAVDTSKPQLPSVFCQRLHL